MTLEGKKILVTGANGFLGTRLVEFLVLACKAEVRALVRDATRSVRLARLPVELAIGDARDERAVQRAVEGCSIVMHCASGMDAGRDALASTTFLGTKVVAQAALRQKAAKLVHISSCAVYGSPGDVEVNEGYPMLPRWRGDAYAEAKIAAEKMLQEMCARGLPAAIVQPTMIYGPYSAEWTIHPLLTLRKADYVLPREGRCNPVYVDDVVRAIVLAAQTEKAAGQRYLVSGPEAVTWAQFYEAYAAMSGYGRVLSASDEELAARTATQRNSKAAVPALRRMIAQHPEIRRALGDIPLFRSSYNLAQRLLPAKRFVQLNESLGKGEGTALPVTEKEVRPSYVPQDGLLKIYRSPSRYDIEKARRELGFTPQADLREGMRLTAEWARWARLTC